jgi:hypothetical protein
MKIMNSDIIYNELAASVHLPERFTIRVHPSGKMPRAWFWKSCVESAAPPTEEAGVAPTILGYKF